MTVRYFVQVFDVLTVDRGEWRGVLRTHDFEEARARFERIAGQPDAPWVRVVDIGGLTISVVLLA